MGRVAVLLAALALTLASTAAAQPAGSRVSADEAVAVFLNDGRVGRWLERYDEREVETSAELSRSSDAWRVVSSVEGVGGAIGRGFARLPRRG